MALPAGAQLSFTDVDGYRFGAILTDQPDPEITVLERHHRARARAEDHIRNDKDTGLRNMPFRDFEHNQVWLALVLIAHDLIAWTQRLLLTGELAKTEPKRLRYRLLHVAARLAFHARPRRCACRPPGPGRKTSPLPSRASPRSPRPPADSPAGPREDHHDDRRPRPRGACPRTPTTTSKSPANHPATASNGPTPGAAHLTAAPATAQRPHPTGSCTIRASYGTRHGGGPYGRIEARRQRHAPTTGARPGNMGIGKYAHPKYYAKRAVNWEANERQAERTGAGCLGILLAIALVVGAVVFLLSVPGHLLGLTPTFNEVFNRSGDWLDTHYQHVVWGFIFTFVVLVVTCGLIAICLEARKRPAPERSRSYVVSTLVVALFVGLIVVLPLGRRDAAISLSRVHATSNSQARIVEEQAIKDVKDELYRPGLSVPDRPICSLTHTGHDALTGDYVDYNCSLTVKGHHGSTARYSDEVECFGLSPSAGNCAKGSAGVRRTR